MNSCKRQLTSAVLFSAVLLYCGHAAAATVTYNFDETGWNNTAGTSENFFGSFTGTPDANGALALSSLTSFSADITETNSLNDTKSIAMFGGTAGITGLNDFLFSPLSNKLTLAATGSPGATICLGDAVQQGLCGPVGPPPVSRTGVSAPPLEGIFLSSINGTLDAGTTALPSITMVGSVLNPPVGMAPQPVSTPEPASFLLCGGALIAVSLGLSYCRSRKRPADAGSSSPKT